MCVVVMVALLGNTTLMPLGVGMMFVMGMFVCTRFVLHVSSCLPSRKVPVAPVSATSGLLFVLSLSWWRCCRCCVLLSDFFLLHHLDVLAF